jgi:hypothetical protein
MAKNQFNNSPIRNQFRLILIGFAMFFNLVSCTKTIYFEDLTNRLEPVRTVDVLLGTKTQVFKNDFLTFEEGYYVHYNKYRVTWYPNRIKTKEISVPIKEVSKISYRSRLVGALVGLGIGYGLGYFAYNLGVLNKPGQPFLSQYNQSVSLGFATVFGVSGYFAGFPYKYVFKYKKKRARLAKDFIILPDVNY